MHYSLFGFACPDLETTFGPWGYFGLHSRTPPLFKRTRQGGRQCALSIQIMRPNTRTTKSCPKKETPGPGPGDRPRWDPSEICSTCADPARCVGACRSWARPARLYHLAAGAWSSPALCSSNQSGNSCRDAKFRLATNPVYLSLRCSSVRSCEVWLPL